MEVQKEDIFHEILEFAVSIVWLGIAFGIAIAGGIDAFKDLVGLRTIIVESLVVVFFAFVFHELAHRIAARRFSRCLSRLDSRSPHCIGSGHVWFPVCSPWRCAHSDRSEYRGKQGKTGEIGLSRTNRKHGSSGGLCCVNFCTNIFCGFLHNRHRQICCAVSILG